MIKEELEKEAEEYLEKNYCCKTVCTCNEIKECKEGIRIRCTAFNHRKQLIVDFAEPREKRIEELKAQIEKMKCCENCGWFYLQQQWRESKEIDESRMFHCGNCGNKKNWKLKEIKEK